MTHILGENELTADDERARKAVKAFRSLQPTLSAYARVLTHRADVRVEMSATSNGETDGKRIFFRPPIGLGDPTVHIRVMCDKRDSKLQLLCPACSIREQVLVPVYHEIAHIAYETFGVQPSEEDKALALAAIVEGHSSAFAQRVNEKIRQTPTWEKGNFMAMANLVSPFLPMIFNAIEDARINSAQFAARKGTKLMFDADTMRVFDEGVEQVDPKTGEVIWKSWLDYPQNSQMIVGLFCKASGYNYSNWFIPPVVEALDDPELTKILNGLRTVRSSRGVYELSFPVLVRVRELGFCLTAADAPEEVPEPEEEVPQPEGESDDEPQASDGGSDSQESGSNSGSDETDSENDFGGDSEGDGMDSGDGESDDPQAGSEVGMDGAESESSDDDAPGGSGDPDDRDDDGGDGVDADEADGSDPSEDEQSGGSGDDSVEPGESEEGSGSEPADAGEASAESEDGSDDSSPASGESESESVDADAEGSSQADEDASGSAGHSGDSTGITGTDQEPSASDGSGDSSESQSVDSSDQVDHDGESDWKAPDDPDFHTDGGRGPQEVEPADGQDLDTGDGDPSDVVAGVPEDGTSPETEAPDEPIDSGADEGRGGVELHEHESWDHVPMGDPEDAMKGLDRWTHHGEEPHSVEEQERTEALNTAVDRAVIQGIYFETPSKNIWGVREHHYGKPIEVNGYNMSRAWQKDYYGAFGSALGVNGAYETAESLLGPVLLKMRVAFSANKRGAMMRHRKAGRVDPGVLGKRAWNGDERVFRQKILPGKRDYFVVIWLDVSGSTAGTNLDLIKRAAFAQATLLTRMGIPFEMFAASANYHDPSLGRGDGIDLDVYFIKEVDEPWNPGTQQRLVDIGPDSANLDGHAIEYARKRLDRSQATDRIILYFSDGKMPAENHDEELEIMVREIKTCKRLGYHLLGVGIRTDSPARHGLDTVQIDDVGDLRKVIDQLGKYLIVA